MDVVKQLKKIKAEEMAKLPQVTAARGVEKQAVSITRDINVKNEKTDVALWEHEDLAKVRIRVYRGHSGEVNKCQFFCNESKIISCSTDCSVKIWDPKKGKEVKSYDNIHDVNVAAAHCLENGTRFVTCGWDKKVNVWDTETGESLWTAVHLDSLTCCNLSYDGRLACVGSDLFREMYIYDIQAGEVVQNIREFHRTSLTSVRFTPDDTRVITTSTDRTAKFYDLRSDTCTIKLEGHENAIADCSITMDERKFATASWDKTINIWDIATGMYRSKGPTPLKGSHDGSVLSCDFTDDGLQLVSGSADLSIVVWDVENSIKKLKLQGHTGWVTDVHFSKDQNWLLSCSNDKTVRMWNIEESDKIPLVIENKKQKGLKVNKCSKCGKPFSMAEEEDFKDRTLCVFCRLQRPEQTWLSFKDDPDMASPSSAFRE